jgi:hypothetical protein
LEATGAKPTNQIVIDVYDGFFTVKTVDDMTVEEMFTILVGCLQHLENTVENMLDNSGSTMIQ